MNVLYRLFAIPLILVASLSVTANAQSPAPIVVQAANAPATTARSTSTKAAVATDAQSISATIKLLEQIKAANDDVLAKQKAALERLTEMQEAADQLQIFAKRG
jgi:lipopolysaccharide biosynthesis regulator YciM